MRKVPSLWCASCEGVAWMRRCLIVRGCRSSPSELRPSTCGTRCGVSCVDTDAVAFSRWPGVCYCSTSGTLSIGTSSGRPERVEWSQKTQKNIWGPVHRSQTLSEWTYRHIFSILRDHSNELSSIEGRSTNSWLAGTCLYPQKANNSFCPPINSVKLFPLMLTIKHIIVYNTCGNCLQ